MSLTVNVASQANSGFRCYFQISNGDSPETFRTLSEVIDVPGTSESQFIEEVTHMGSPNGNVEKIALGLSEQAPFTLPMNFVADNTDQILLLRTRIREKVQRNYRIVFTDANQTHVTFNAFVSNFEINHMQKSKADLSIEFTPTGGYTWGAITP